LHAPVTSRPALSRSLGALTAAGAHRSHVIPRLALLVFVLAMPRTDDRFTIDHLVRRRAG
jgi:hypothetical protein